MRKMIFTAVNIAIYFLVCSGCKILNSLKVIRLAREEMRVPAEPIFTPKSNAAWLPVNFDNRIADGTLLMNWQERTDTMRVSFSSKEEIMVLTESSLERLPAKMKKKKKVPSRA